MAVEGRVGRHTVKFCGPQKVCFNMFVLEVRQQNMLGLKINKVDIPKFVFSWNKLKMNMDVFVLVGEKHFMSTQSASCGWEMKASKIIAASMGHSWLNGFCKMGKIRLQIFHVYPLVPGASFEIWIKMRQPFKKMHLAICVCNMSVILFRPPYVIQANRYLTSNKSREHGIIIQQIQICTRLYNYIHPYSLG